MSEKNKERSFRNKKVPNFLRARDRSQTASAWQGLSQPIQGNQEASLILMEFQIVYKNDASQEQQAYQYDP